MIFQANLVLDKLNGIICGIYSKISDVEFIPDVFALLSLLQLIIQKDTQKMLNNGNSIIHLMLIPKGYIGCQQSLLLYKKKWLYFLAL